MGRREQPVDPTEGPAAAFAVELRKVRAEAGGLSYRVMAARTNFSAATLAQAAAGKKLPTLPVTLAYVEACGGNAPEWQARWQQAVAASHDQEDSGPTQAPYRGLARFETDDCAFFFGRTALVERLVALVQAHRIVMVVGPSGCGKSSLVRAGLVPMLRPRPVRVLTPGAHPQFSPAGIADQVVIVDQFEETFTLCADPAERQTYIDTLVAASRDAHGNRVVLAVRADFFDRCTHHPELIDAVRDSTMPVRPMNAAELREAVTKPAAAVGLIVQRELTARIIEEVTGQPGGLPLMSHALLETWRRHQGKALTKEAYEAAGGIHGAVANTAEQLYAELIPAQRERLRDLLLRLITPGEAGAHDTRRPVARAELLTGQPNDPGPQLLEQLAAARLITLDDDTADLAHEALLTAWPRLRSWVEEDRERLRVHRRLTEAANAWQDHARDPGALYRGTRLAIACEHLAERAEALTPQERVFLDASTAASHSARRRGRRRTTVLSVLMMLVLLGGSLAWQQSMATSRQKREAHARQIIGVAESLRQSDPQLSMRLSLAAWHLADLPETRAALRTASLQPQQDSFTDLDTRATTMRWLSADGHSMFSIGATQVTRWDVDSHRPVATTAGLPERLNDVGEGDGDAHWLPFFDPGPPITVSLWDMTTGHRDLKPLDTADQGIEVSPSGHRLITYQANGSRYRVRVWDTATRELVLQVSTPRRSPTRRPPTWESALAAARDMHRGRSEGEVGTPDVTLSPDDKTMVLCVPGEPLQVWNLEASRRVDVPGMPSLSAQQCWDERLHLTPDGRRLLMATDTQIRVWDLPSGKEVPAIREPGVKEIGFSTDGTFLATANADELLVWRSSQADAPLFRHPLAGEHAFNIRIDPVTDQLRYLAGSPHSLAWPATIRTLQLNGIGNSDWRDDSTLSAAFSLGGTTLATTYPNRVELRDGRTGRRLPGPAQLPCPTAASSSSPQPNCRAIAAFRPDGAALAYGNMGANPFRVKIWDLASQRITDRVDLPPASDASALVEVLAYTPTTNTLLMSGFLSAGSLTAWDMTRHTAIAATSGISGTKIAIAPTGRLLVTSQGNVADLTSGPPIVRANGLGPASALAFSPDGTLLAAGDQTGQTALWDGSVRRNLGTLTPTSPYASSAVSALAFSPDDSLLAVGTVNGAIQLWDTTTRQPIGAPLTTPVGYVAALEITNDTLYVAGEHIPLQRYDLTPAAAATTICRRAGRGLTPRQLDGIPSRLRLPAHLSAESRCHRARPAVAASTTEGLPLPISGPCLPLVVLDPDCDRAPPRDAESAGSQNRCPAAVSARSACSWISPNEARNTTAKTCVCSTRRLYA